MKLNEIAIGTQMQVEVRQLLEREEFVTVKARVLGFAGTDRIILEQPIFRAMPVPLIEDDWIKVFFSTPDKHYSLMLSFEDFERVENMRGIRLKLVSKIEEIQRRNYFRLKSSIEVKMGLIYREGALENSDITYHNSLAYDLSGGGMRLTSDDSFEKGDKVECIFGVANNEMRVQGDIVWKNNPDNGQKNKCELGVQFKFTVESAREAVISFIFEEQRRILRKEGKLGSVSK